MNGTILKLIALLLMLADHIHQFIPNTPIILTWLGRLSAPIFMFCMVWGLFYTHNRKKYLFSMYLWSIGMAVGEIILSCIFPTAEKTLSLTNNIFSTLLLVGIVVSIIELFQKDDFKKGTIWLVSLIAVQIVGLIAVSLCMFLLPTGYNIWLLPNAILPSLLTCEGGFIWVGCGVGLYFFRKSKLKLSLFYIAFCALYFLISVRAPYTLESIFINGYQWMMIGSLPFMLSYNGKKGSGLKWLFYAFYPAHIFILFVLGATIFA